MHQLVEDRVDGHPQLHLELLQPDRQAAEAELGHHLLGVDRPALDERAGPAQRPHPGRRRGTGGSARAAGSGRASPRARSGCAPCGRCTRGRTTRPAPPASPPGSARCSRTSARRRSPAGRAGRSRPPPRRGRTPASPGSRTGRPPATPGRARGRTSVASSIVDLGQVDDRGVVGVLGGEPVQRRGAPSRRSAGPPTSSAAAVAELRGDPVQVRPGPAQHLGGGQLGVEGVPEPRLPQPAAQPRVAARVAARQPGRAASRRTRPARPARPRRPARTAAAQARRLRPAAPGTSSRTSAAVPANWPTAVSSVDPRAVAQHRPGGGQRVRHARRAGRRAASSRSLGRRERPGHQRVQQRARVVRAAGSTRARGPRSARTAPRSTSDGRIAWSTRSCGVELVGVHAGQRVGGVAQHRRPGRRPPSAERSGSRSSKRWSPAEAASAGSALEQRVDDALGERHELRHARQPTRAAVADGPTSVRVGSAAVPPRRRRSA